MISPVLIFIILVMLMLALSVRERVRTIDYKARSWDGSETRTSPLSEALTGLLGTAGGIYLSLAMIFSFMEIKVPSSVELLNVNLEPLAAFSISMAIFQPFFIRLWHARKKF